MYCSTLLLLYFQAIAQYDIHACVLIVLFECLLGKLAKCHPLLPRGHTHVISTDITRTEHDVITARLHKDGERVARDPDGGGAHGALHAMRRGTINSIALIK